MNSTKKQIAAALGGSTRYSDIRIYGSLSYQVDSGPGKITPIDFILIYSKLAVMGGQLWTLALDISGRVLEKTYHKTEVEALNRFNAAVGALANLGRYRITAQEAYLPIVGPLPVAPPLTGQTRYAPIIRSRFTEARQRGLSNETL